MTAESLRLGLKPFNTTRVCISQQFRKCLGAHASSWAKQGSLTDAGEAVQHWDWTALGYGSNDIQDDSRDNKSHIVDSDTLYSNGQKHQRAQRVEVQPAMQPQLQTYGAGLPTSPIPSQSSPS